MNKYGRSQIESELGQGSMATDYRITAADYEQNLAAVKAVMAYYSA